MGNEIRYNPIQASVERDLTKDKLDYNPIQNGTKEDLATKVEDFKTNYLPEFLNEINPKTELRERIRNAELSGNLSTQAEAYLKVYQIYVDETSKFEECRIGYELEEALEKSQLMVLK